MLRSFITALLPATLFLMGPALTPVQGRWDRPVPASRAFPNIAGRYVVGGGGTCFVYPRGDRFLFVNEHGSRAIFVWTGRGRLGVARIIDGWDPNIIVTVEHDALGRMVLRFDAPATPTGYWTRVS